VEWIGATLRMRENKPMLEPMIAASSLKLEITTEVADLWAQTSLVSFSVWWKLISTYEGGKAITCFLTPPEGGQQNSEVSSKLVELLGRGSENPWCRYD
jgi:hypothetical protein